MAKRFEKSFSGAGKADPMIVVGLINKGNSNVKN